MLYIFTYIYIQGEFVSQSRATLVGNHFLHSCEPNVWFRGDYCLEELGSGSS